MWLMLLFGIMLVVVLNGMFRGENLGRGVDLYLMDLKMYFVLKVMVLGWGGRWVVVFWL